MTSIVPPNVAKTYGTIAASIKRSAEGMGNWGLEELTLGLYKVANKHLRDKVMDSIEGNHLTSREEMLEILHWLRWAMAAYEPDEEALSKILGISPSSILKHSTKADMHKPSYYIAVDSVRCTIVLGVRGTSEVSDVLTDLTSHSEPFEGGYAHSGMLEAAQWISKTEANFLKQTLLKFQNYSLILVGHSLGAGTAALLSCLLRESKTGSGMPAQQAELAILGVPASKVECWAFACPPCVDKERAARCCPFLRSVVLQDDVVARVSPASLEDLRQEILSTDWKEAFGEGSVALRMAEMAERSKKLVSHFEKGAGYKEGHILSQVQTFSLKTVAMFGQRVAQGQKTTTTTTTSTWFSTASKLAGTVASIAAKEAEKAVSAVQPKDIKAQTPEEVKKSRLFVPGTLYHIVRKPIEKSERPQKSLEDLLEWETSSNLFKSDNSAEGQEIKFWSREESSVAGTSNGTPNNNEKGETLFRFSVVKGANPHSRFRRIVLSSTMLTDHNCGPYGQALVNAMQWV